MSRPTLIDALATRRATRRPDGMQRLGLRSQRADARVGDWTSTRMNAEISEERRIDPHLERQDVSRSDTKPRRAPWRLFSVLACIARNGATHDAATFFQIEYSRRACPLRYTTARTEQLQAELLGPPPLGF